MAWLYVGSVAAALLAALHSYLGERTVLPALLGLANLPVVRYDRAFTEAILRWAWHLTSIAWLGWAIVLWALADGSPADRAFVSRIAALVFGVSGVIVVGSTRGRHVAGPLFAVAALASWFGV
ncbi:MAG: hypothetical protein ABR499_07860 [Gemmatimonadaceae bacterium]